MRSTVYCLVCLRLLCEVATLLLVYSSCILEAWLKMAEETEASVIVISSDASSPEKVFTPTKR